VNSGIAGLGIGVGEGVGDYANAGLSIVKLETAKTRIRNIGEILLKLSTVNNGESV
jgi:hypothetical protein